MAEIRNVLKNGGEVRNPTEGKVGERELPGVQKTNSGGAGTGKAAGKPGEGQRAGAEVQAGRQILSDAVTGKETSQLEAARLLSALGGSSATDKLLGLDLRPTMSGALVAPPGNSDFLRHLSPTMRRTIMRNMLSRQRERMRKLAKFLRDERDNQGEKESEKREESFLEVLNGPVGIEDENLVRAINELGRSARMLDVLDELLAMQDYTISQIGTFSQG